MTTTTTTTTIAAKKTKTEKKPKAVPLEQLAAAKEAVLAHVVGDEIKATMDPAFSERAAQAIEAAKAAKTARTALPKATTAHGFALVTAYGVALGGERPALDALREVIATFPEGIRRRAIEIARKKELPGGGCDAALKLLAGEQSTEAAASPTRRGLASRTLKVTGSSTKYLVVRVNAEIDAGLFASGAEFSIDRVVVNGKLTVTLVQL